MTDNRGIRTILIVGPVRKDLHFISSASRASLMDSVDNVICNKIVLSISSIDDDVGVVGSIRIEFCEWNFDDELIVTLVQVAGFSNFQLNDYLVSISNKK